MIPAMMRALFGVTPDELGFSVIAMSSAFFEHVAVIFAGDRIQRPCAIATDLDKALIDLPDSPEDDTTDQAHARASEESGKSRHDRLHVLANGNPWIRTFLAVHTFEVDFIGADNSSVVVKTLDGIYSQTAAKDRSQEKLESADIEESGTEVLRLAKGHGKGWFALLLSEKLVSHDHIPEYILRAVAFACHPSIDEGALKQMGEFRVRTEGPGGELAKVLPPLAELEKLAPTDFLSVFRKAAPTDELSLFCQYVEEYREG